MEWQCGQPVQLQWGLPDQLDREDGHALPQSEHRAGVDVEGRRLEPQRTIRPPASSDMTVVVPMPAGFVQEARASREQARKLWDAELCGA